MINQKGTMRRILLAALLTLVGAVVAPATVEANFAGDACNHLRYSGGAQATTAQITDARWGPYNWHWFQVGGNTPVGFAVNTSGMRADGSGFCYASWYTELNWSTLKNICPFYANKAANGTIFSRLDGACHG